MKPCCLIAFISLCSTTGAAAQTIDRSAASKMTTGQLARVLLPNQPAGRFTSHELIQEPFPLDNFPGVRFFARPSPLGSDLCIREVVYVDLEPVNGSDVATARKNVRMKFERALNKVQIVAASKCRTRSGDLFAWVQPENAITGAQQALRQLVSLQVAARRRAPLRVKVTCRTDAPSNECNGSSRDLLANLPLRRIQTIDWQDGDWKMAILPERNSDHLWELVLPPAEGTEQEIRLNWHIPAPF